MFVVATVPVRWDTSHIKIVAHNRVLHDCCRSESHMLVIAVSLINAVVGLVTFVELHTDLL